MRYVLIAGMCCAALLSAGCHQKPGAGSEPRELVRQLGPACLAAKTSDQFFDLRNWRAEAAQQGKALSVTGCFATNAPEATRKAWVSFVVFDAKGTKIGEDGYQIFTPTKTVGWWSPKSPKWTVPVGVLVKANAELAKNVEATIKWLDENGLWRQEKYWLGVTQARHAENAFSVANLAEEETPAGCASQGNNNRFEITNARSRIVGPRLKFTADMRNADQPAMARAWLVVTAFDKAGNMIGVNGAELGNPPPASGPLAIDVLPAETNTKISNMVLLTFRWYAKDGCRWSENYFVDTVRQ